MSDFPHWQTRSTGDVFYVRGRIGWRNLRRSDFCEDGPHLITGMHIDGSGRVDWSRCFRIPPKRYEESPEIKVEKGDLVITKDGTIGKVALIDWLPGETSLNSHLFLVRPIDPDQHSSRFAFHVFRSNAFGSFIQNQKSGSTLEGLGEAKFVKFGFPVPPRPEQDLVAAVLDTVGAAIQETEAIIAKLKAIKQGLLEDLLTRGIGADGELRPPRSEAPHLYRQSPLGWIPKEWELKTLGQVLSEPTKNGLYKPSQFHGRGPLMVQMGGLFAGDAATFETATRVHVTPFELSVFGLEVGDLLFARRSLVFEGAGQCVIVRDLPERATFESSIVRARLNKGEANPEFVCQFLRGYASGMQRRTLIRQVAVSGVSSQDIRELLTPLPSPDEQLLIVKRLQAIQERVDVEQSSLSKLRSQKTGLMDDLMTGRVRVTPLLEHVEP